MQIPAMHQFFSLSHHQEDYLCDYYFIMLIVKLSDLLWRTSILFSSLMEQIEQCGRVKQVAEGNATAASASLCVCAWLISHVWEIHQVLNNILQMQGGDTRWRPDLNQRDGETWCVQAHLQRANKPSRQLLISSVSGDPRRWRAAVLMEHVKLRQGDSINSQAGSSQQFMVSRLTGQGGAQGSKITILRRSMITARGSIAYASDQPPPLPSPVACALSFWMSSCSGQHMDSFWPFAHGNLPWKRHLALAKHLENGC